MKALADCHVLVTPTSYGVQDERLRTDLEQQVGRVTYNSSGKPLTSADLQALLPGVDGMIAGLDAVDAAALAAAGALQVVARYGVGVSNVDLEAARQRGIVVTNTPGANAKSVAELTLALMLNLLRPVHQASAETRQGNWPRLKGISLESKTVGLVGLGAIGKEVARRLMGFDCRVLAYDPVQDADFAMFAGVRYIPLEELLAAADVVSLHLPALPETYGLVDAAFLAHMQPGSYLINTARGELVDEAALLDALQSGRLRGAALDVFANEPPGAENPLLQLPQVLPTPHMGAHTDGATNAMGWMALKDCLAVLQGQAPLYRVV
ncbi:MAG: phosphoglycerate dehydrogenase [Anaerolineales bacterium]|jgi:D-3-phosphoglycerate dehydrogenase